MREYIRKEYINNLLEGFLDRWFGPEYYACSIIQDELEDVPETEIVRLQYGHWIVGLDGSYICPKCDTVFRYESGHYCANCGTRLDYEE